LGPRSLRKGPSHGKPKGEKGGRTAARRNRVVWVFLVAQGVVNGGDWGGNTAGKKCSQSNNVTARFTQEGWPGSPRRVVTGVSPKTKEAEAPELPGT